MYFKIIFTKAMPFSTQNTRLYKYREKENKISEYDYNRYLERRLTYTPGNVETRQWVKESSFTGIFDKIRSYKY